MLVFLQRMGKICTLYGRGGTTRTFLKSFQQRALKSFSKSLHILNRRGILAKEKARIETVKLQKGGDARQTTYVLRNKTKQATTCGSE